MDKKLGYVEFSEHLIYTSFFDEDFLEKNDTLLKDMSESLWEDYFESDLPVKHYAKIASIILDRVCSYGISC